MKFREKTYIITLILFLVFLNAGIFSLAVYTYHSNAEASKEVCCAEEKVIYDAFVKDFDYLTTVSAKPLMKKYGEFYTERDIYLAFWVGDMEIYSTLPEGLNSPQTGNSSTQRAGGKRYFLITEEFHQYTFTYAKDVSYLDEDFKHISIVFVITSLGASALLAVILFFVLRRLSRPLEKLRSAAGEIANGNFDIRADESGKDEFSLLAADFNRMAEHVSVHISQLEQNTKVKQDMLDNLAHEMRTPLTSIRGYAEYLRDANIGEEEKIEAIEFIISESERLKHIGEKLLDEAFIRENGITPERVNIGKLIADSAKMLSIKASHLGVELKAVPEMMYLDCDRLLMNLLITNLTENAVKACKDGGRVIVGCRENENGKTEIFVSDNGVGMTEEQLKHITEPFYRTDKSRARNDGGTGLGLALCARIAKAHNAELKFESSVGKGCTARITF